MRLGILFFGMALYRRAGGRYRSAASIFNMLQHFPRRFETELVCPISDDVGEGSEVDLRQLTLHALPTWRNGVNLYTTRFLPVCWRLRKIIHDRAPFWDAVLIIDPDPASQVAFLLSGWEGLERIVYLRGDDSYEIRQRNRRGLRRLIASAWCRWLDWSIPRMLAKSIGVVTGRALYERYRLHDPMLYTATSITEADAANRRAEYRRKSASHLRLLFVGNLTHYKGVDTAIRAVSNAAANGLEVRLDIIGTGPAEADLRSLVAELPAVKDSVCFVGYVPYGEELFRHFRAADLLLLPSQSEGTPKVIPEAFSFGVPVIATRVGGIPEMVLDGVNGFLVDIDEPARIAEILYDVSQTEGLLPTLRDGAFASVQTYAIETQLGRLYDVISKATLYKRTVNLSREDRGISSKAQ